MKVDLKVVEPDQLGNVGSTSPGRRPTRATAKAAVRRGLHVSEYGILDDETGRRCAERAGEVYERPGLAWIPPELREGRGELDAAANGELPNLGTLDDLRGDLHCDTTLWDGREDARGDGRDGRDPRLGVPRRSPTTRPRTVSVTTSRPRRWRRGSRRSRRTTTTLDDFTVLAGTEVQHPPDGSLDYPDQLVERLDWVIGSVHTSFTMTGEQAMTDRVDRRIESPWITRSATHGPARSRPAPVRQIDMAA